MLKLEPDSMTERERETVDLISVGEEQSYSKKHTRPYVTLTLLSCGQHFKGRVKR